MISVVIPVGSNAEYRKYLDECIDSVRSQTFKVDEILVVDDMAGLDGIGEDVNVWKTPWYSGVAHAFNFGVALARNPLVFMLGSDDRLEPWCIMDCLEEWSKRVDVLGYYYVDVQYSDGRSQSLACHAAMVHKCLWERTGGLPVESAVGASDTVFISMLLAAKGVMGRLWHVKSEKPPYWYRVHDQTDTALRNKHFAGLIWAVREYYSQNPGKPIWIQ